MNNCSKISNETLDFSDDEIRSELSRLGYNDIDQSQFEDFKKDLLTLVQADRSSSFSSQHSKSQQPRYHPSGASRYDELYEPPVYSRSPVREKENVDSISRPYVPVERRLPLSSGRSNNSVYRTAREPVKHSASKHYASRHSDYRLDEAARSLPVPRYPAVDLYHPVDEPVDRPRSADGIRRYSDRDFHRVYDSEEGDIQRHLDDYWYDKRNPSASRNYHSPYSPSAGGDYHSPYDRYQRDDVPHSSSKDYTTASQSSPAAVDDQLSHSLNDKLNLSRTSQSSVVKRKVSRKMSDGTSRVFEESHVKDDSDTETESVVSSCSERLSPAYINYTGPESTRITFHKEAGRGGERGETTNRTRLPSTRYDKSVDPVKSAVIWPEPKPVSSRNMVKTDPVSRYQQYQQEWSKSKVPEEKKHKNLRWAVREQMLYRDVIYEKPQKKFVENRYVVPTDKKRKDLRWRIRADMAAGILPNSS